MDEVYYLVHTTNDPNCVNWTELKTGKFNTDNQFPGVYLSVITKDNINEENIYSGKYIIILSKKLLLQNNYHMNLIDYNGIVSEKNTYFPWSLDTFISESNKLREKLLTEYKRPQNEVVFHDNIDMKYCCGIISIVKRDTNIRINNFLPNLSIENEEEPDMTKQPFFCYPFEDIYTGSDKLPKSSTRWYKMMSNVCNIDIDDTHNTREDMIKKITDKANELYNNREQQNIALLQKYTHNVMGGKKNKSKSKKKYKHNKKTVRKPFYTFERWKIQ